MIGGAAQADVAVLVISARKGEFETGFERDGQTREHTTLAKTLGIRRLVVAINKMDDPTVKWSKERYDDIVNKLQPFICKQVGFDKKFVTFLPLSAYTGHGVIDKVPKDVCSWNTSGSLIEVLDTLHLDRKNIDGPLRIPIIDKYRDMGVTAVLGKIESGKVQVGDVVTIMPNKVPVEVLKITLHEEEVDLAKCGDNATLYLKGIEVDDVKQGHVICDSNNLCQPVQEFIGQFLVLDMPIFSAGYSAVLHIHTSIVECTITRLVNKIDKKTGKPLPNKINFAQTGDIVNAVIKCSRAICLEKFDVLQSMGRFTLREGRTVGIGKVTAIKPLKNVEKDPSVVKKKQ
jgi:peptide chain release factor subunit 3